MIKGSVRLCQQDAGGVVHILAHAVFQKCDTVPLQKITAVDEAPHIPEALVPPQHPVDVGYTLKITTGADLEPRLQTSGAAVVVVEVEDVQLLGGGILPDALQRMGEQRRVHQIIAVDIQDIGTLCLAHRAVAGVGQSLPILPEQMDVGVLPGAALCDGGAVIGGVSQREDDLIRRRQRRKYTLQTGGQIGLHVKNGDDHAECHTIRSQ